MDNIKYTSDGKKVLVVGKLNADQTIVQEIFVSAGQEIPSGENFVVKSLHDAPAESWKEKNLRELEQRYERYRQELELKIEQQNNRLNLAISKAKLRTDALMSFANNSDDSQIDTLKKFMCGEITHLFMCDYSPEIIDFVDSSGAYSVDNWHGRMKLDGMKLVSLYGRSNGSLSYKLSRYTDGSGGCGTEIFPASSYAEALVLAQAELDKQGADYLAGNRSGISLDSWQKIEGIKIPTAVIERYEADADAERVKRIEKLKKELAELEAKKPAKAKKTG